MSFKTQNELAAHFLSLHKPGDPVVLANVYDILSTKAILSLKPTALASASFAIANSFGISDPELTMELNLEGVKRIVSAIPKSSANPDVLAVPLTVDIQDGYGDRLEECIKAIIALGAVGCNLEETYDAPTGEKHVLRPINEQIERLKTVRRVATEAGVPDFVINARLDAIYNNGDAGVAEFEARGKAYLESGAPSSLFCWGGPARGLSDAEVAKYAKEFGRINVMARPAGVNGVGSAGGISIKEMASLGVARVSCGPYLMKRAMDSYTEAAAALFAGEGLQVKRFGA